MRIVALLLSSSVALGAGGCIEVGHEAETGCFVDPTLPGCKVPAVGGGGSGAGRGNGGSANGGSAGTGGGNAGSGAGVAGAANGGAGGEAGGVG